MVRQEKAVGREQKPRSRTALATAALGLHGPQIHHGRTDRLGHRDDHARIGIEGIALVGLGRRGLGNGGEGSERLSTSGNRDGFMRDAFAENISWTSLFYATSSIAAVGCGWSSGRMTACAPFPALFEGLSFTCPSARTAANALSPSGSRK